MSFFNFFRKSPPPSANAARARLKMVLAHERAGHKGPDYLPKLHRDLIRVVRKYITVPDDSVSVRVKDSGTTNRLEVNIDLPTSSLVH